MDLNKVQRTVLLLMSGAMTSTPTAGMEAALGLLPLDLHIESEAMKARARTRPLLESTWDGLAINKQCRTNKKGHQRHWDDTLKQIFPLNTQLDREPYSLNWVEPVRDFDEISPEVIIYTDGSNTGKDSGFGWAACVGDQVIAEKCGNLGKASVFQAEVFANIKPSQVEEATGYMSDSIRQ